MTNGQKENKTGKRKRRLAVIAAVIAALLVVVTAAYFILGNIAGGEKDYGYKFYEPDWDADIMLDQDYLERGWYMTYTNEYGESVMILDDDYLRHGIGVELLSYYFAAVQSGDSDTYNSLFGDEYIKANGKHEPFTPQRIYDIRVRLLGSEQISDEGEATRYSYEVQFKIMKNDGTFTRLIGSDMSRIQYFTIYSSPDEIYIESIASSFRKK